MVQDTPNWNAKECARLQNKSGVLSHSFALQYACRISYHLTSSCKTGPSSALSKLEGLNGVN